MTGTGIVVKRCGGRGPEASVPVPVPVNGGLPGIDGTGPGSETDEWREKDPDIWGAGGRGAYSYGVAGWVVNPRVSAGAGAVTL
jgi:hypothetical protein